MTTPARLSIREAALTTTRSEGRESVVSWQAMRWIAGLVDRIQLTVFPVITGQTSDDPIFLGAADFDLELIDSRTLDRNIQELVYRPTLHA